MKGTSAIFNENLGDLPEEIKEEISRTLFEEPEKIFQGKFKDPKRKTGDLLETSSGWAEIFLGKLGGCSEKGLWIIWITEG